MGRKKSFDRAEALQTVMNEIWRNGYEASSVKALSEKLGLTRSSFYNSFGSREELFLEVMQVYFEQSPDRVLGEIPENSDGVLKEICKVFKAACIARASDQERRGCLAINSVVELVGNDEKVGPVLVSAVEASIERFERLLALAKENGELDNKDIRTLAVAVQNVLAGLNVICKILHSADELWASTKLSLTGLGIYKPSFRL